MRTRLRERDVARASQALEGAPAQEVIAWAAETFGKGLSLVCSFQNCVLLDLVLRQAPDVDVLFVDTGCHFPETLELVEQAAARYPMRLRVVRPGPDGERCPPGAPDCCALRKVQPLARALRGRDAWIAGVRRSDSPSRANTPVVSWDGRWGLAKVNPLVDWTDDDMEAYARLHDLPTHRLLYRGFPSIGCSPCTSPVVAGADKRSGRWAGTAKTECGIHG
jgi:phosphoadenosine phosphosulfate reductase